MKIGVAGCGGIGSNVAMHLVRCGVKNFKLVDFDKIEKSNLNRQFFFEDQIGLYKCDTLCENLKRINPSISIETLNLKITENNILSIFDDCDIIIEAFDKKEYKVLLIESYKNKNIVSANGIGGLSLNEVKTLKLKNLTIVGDFSTDIDTYKTYSTKVMYIATIMANNVLDIIGGYYEQKN
nr:sulfur carrier protein ThiS adenylyltransferase ThiF [uncultured Cetobacterium sp.]